MTAPPRPDKDDGDRSVQRVIDSYITATLVALVVIAGATTRGTRIVISRNELKLATGGALLIGPGGFSRRSRPPGLSASTPSHAERAPITGATVVKAMRNE
jgi:hypothetical protein